MYQLPLEKKSWVCNIVEEPGDLPETGHETMFLDVETNGINPYLNDKIAGIAVVFGRSKETYYIPLRHAQGRNVPIHNVREWLLSRNTKVKRWVNHNVKFDAHFLYNEGAPFEGELVDTIVMAKLWSSDLIQYGLKRLAKKWLRLPMDEEDEVHTFLRNVKGLTAQERKSRYDLLPIDLCGRYAAMDVFATRMLYDFLNRRYNDDLKTLLETEIKMTRLLFEIERVGLRVDEKELLKEDFLSTTRIIKAGEKLSELTGTEFVDSNKFLTDLFIRRHSLPILEITDKGQPSFADAALKQYTVHPSVISSEELTTLFKWVNFYRQEVHFKSLFLEAYEKYKDKNNRIHPSYNQLVRTGRLSCARPNFQQADKRAKKLIIPSEGYEFFSSDASQLEFRIIVHYLRDPKAIEAYVNDPKTDFHQWVADLCKIDRSAAKNINFAIAYGAGKEKILNMLAEHPDIIKMVTKELQNKGLQYDPTLFRRILRRAVEDILHTYHRTLPTLKHVTQRAANVCRSRGWVFNICKRRRHLPQKASYRAFNSIIQGSAMDLIKLRMIELDEYLREFHQGSRIVANVHDEVLLEVPKGESKNLKDEILGILQTTPEAIGLRVPILWDWNSSASTWAEAKA